jgi:hypothetical protein
MGKCVSFFLSVLLFFDFFGCAALRVKFAEKAGLEMMRAVMVNPVYDEKGELLTCSFGLHWDDREYEAFGFADNKHIGELFGLTINLGGGTDLVYLAAGEKPEEWLVWSIAQPMGFLALYKEKSVTEIPEWIASLIKTDEI